MPPVRRCRPLLGTYVEMAVGAGLQGAAAARAMEDAFEAVARVARLMSFHDPRSELSRLNAAAAGSELTLDPWTFELLEIAQGLRAATRGSFDCGVGARLVRWRLLPRHPGAASAAGVRDSSLARVELLEAHRVRIARPVCLDLGGIAKGFAVDKAVEAMAAAGVAEAVVNAGGDLRVLGPRPQPIHVRRPCAPQTLAYLGDLADGAAATSATYPAFWPGVQTARGALVDPRRGRAVTQPRSFTVIAPACAVADGLTKALAVDGALDAACLRRYGAQAVVVP